MSEETWEAYFKERATLDYRVVYNNSEDPDREAVWQEPFPKPMMTSDVSGTSYEGLPTKSLSSLARIDSGCVGLPNTQEQAHNTKSSFYFINYW